MFWLSTVRPDGRPHVTPVVAAWVEGAVWFSTGATTTVVSGPPARNIAPSAGQHQAGTCRMGADPANSVTDPDGRVWGHANLRVVDGSLHVTNGGGEPGADHLRRRVPDNAQLGGLRRRLPLTG